MKSKILKIAAASLLVTVSVVTAAGCSFKVDMPENLKQILCEHEWKEGDVLRSATCEREGEVELVCKLCGATDVDELDKLDHIAETVAGKAATCTADGYTDGERCIVGGEWITAPKTLKATGHIDEDNNGTCNSCKGSIFEDATFEAVAKGDVLAGWYRIGMAPAVWGDEGPTNFQTGYLTLGAAKISSDNENVTLNSSATATLMLDNTNSGTLQYETLDIEVVNDDHEKPDGWSVYALGQKYDIVKGFTFVGEYTYICFRDIVTVSYMIVGMVNGVEQTQQKTVTVSGFTFDSCTFSFEKVVF